MSGSFNICSSNGSYPVHIQEGSLAALLTSCQQDIIVADDYFASNLFLNSDLARAVLLFKATEKTKSLNFAPILIEQLRRAGATRQTRLVAIGGGVIQDLTAFAASIYMRGVSWIFIPTTILAMVDSCIGGKSAINVGPYKNLVGNFHPPAAVFVDPVLAVTLPLDQQASGIIEAAKICFCRGPEAFHRYLAFGPTPGMETVKLTSLISHSLQAKKWFIEIDEFDSKERLLLNFGHTFGHAIEGASDYTISHGLAVGLGMLCAFEFVRQSVTNEDPYSRSPMVRDLEEHLAALLHSVFALPERLASLSLEDALERFESDKKHNAENYVLILAKPSGQVAIQRIPKSPETRERVRTSIKKVMESYK